MARCKDCIHGMACGRFNISRVILCGDKADERCSMFQSTADVVPRAEVAREIFDELDRKLLHEIKDLYPVEIYIELKKKYTEEQ